VRRWFVSEHAGQYPVSRLCPPAEAPGGTLHPWRSRPVSQRDLDVAALAEDSTEILDGIAALEDSTEVSSSLDADDIFVGLDGIAPGPDGDTCLLSQGDPDEGWIFSIDADSLAGRDAVVDAFVTSGTTTRPGSDRWWSLHPSRNA
jgi:hypothetical protein